MRRAPNLLRSTRIEAGKSGQLLKPEDYSWIIRQLTFAEHLGELARRVAIL